MTKRRTIHRPYPGDQAVSTNIPVTRGHKVKDKNKFVPDVKGASNDHLTGDLESWDSAVIKTADHFTVCTMQGPSRGGRHTVVYRTFLEAYAIAKDNPRALIYAITKEERSACVPRKMYQDVAVMWHELSPTDILPCVFPVGTGWYSYGHGRTTGPWPDDNQAILVCTLINQLQTWNQCTASEQDTLRRAIKRLNVRLQEQGRAPLVFLEEGEGPK